MATKKINFTKAAIDGLDLPAEGQRAYHYDAKTRGLAVCVTWTGAKSFYVYRKINGKPERIRIGTYPDLTIEQARRKAEEINGQIAQGGDPQEERRRLRANPTFGELFGWYMEQHAKPRKITWDEDEARFRNHLGSLAGIKVARISRADIRELHAKIGREVGPYAANRTLALVRTVINKGIRYELIAGPNPAAGVEMFREQSRDRRLTQSEIPAFFQAVAEETNHAVRDYVLLSLFTGARRTNVLSMRWDQLDFSAATWRIPHTKNGTAQTIPLGEVELEILKRRQAAVTGPWVFPSKGQAGHMIEPRKGWLRILARAGIADLRLHDLRRSLGSWMVDTGASLPVIGKTLNHMSHTTTAIYARLSMDPVREAKARAIGAMLSNVTAKDKAH